MHQRSFNTRQDKGRATKTPSRKLVMIKTGRITLKLCYQPLRQPEILLQTYLTLTVAWFGETSSMISTLFKG